MEMIDIEALKKEIVERMKPLRPEKIILFGSYASGSPTEDSDIDLFIVKEIPAESTRDFSLQAKKRLRDLVFDKNISFDVFVDSSERIIERIENVQDHFYKEIFEKGHVLYE
jgi:predicted nucleotidyltransferase